MIRARVALIGFGDHEPAQCLNALQQAPSLELVAWYDPDARRNSRQPEMPVPAAESPEDILGSPSVDAVLVMTCGPSRMRMAMEAASRGKHVWMDKPVAASVSEADAVIDACKAGKVILAVGCDFRRRPAVRETQRLIQQDRIGTVMMMEGHLAGKRGLMLTPRQWQQHKDSRPGEQIVALGLHHIDAMQYLAGPIAEVTCFTTPVMPEQETEDTAALLLRFENGVIGYAGTSFASPRRTSMIVFGTKGRIEAYFGTQDEVMCFDIHGNSEEIRVGPTDVLAGLFREFGDCILEGASPETAGTEARANLAVVEAALQSAFTGRAVSIPRQPAGQLRSSKTHSRGQ